MQTVALIAASKQRADRPALAQDLYTGDLFRKARAYAEARRLPWLILSARHGLVAPDVTLEPYDATIETLSAAERYAWTTRVAAQIRESMPRTTTLLVLASEAYHAPLSMVLNRWSDPLAGRSITSQRAWLAQETATLLAARAELDRCEGRGTLGNAMAAQREGRALVEHTARIRGIVQ